MAICKKCAIGADLITQLREEMDPADVTGQNDYRARDFVKVAKTLHGLCKGNTHCDCQHHINTGDKIPKVSALY